MAAEFEPVAVLVEVLPTVGWFVVTLVGLLETSFLPKTKGFPPVLLLLSVVVDFP